jgi:hypothetical protein
VGAAVEAKGVVSGAFGVAATGAFLEHPAVIIIRANPLAKTIVFISFSSPALPVNLRYALWSNPLGTVFLLGTPALDLN